MHTWASFEAAEMDIHHNVEQRQYLKVQLGKIKYSEVLIWFNYGRLIFSYYAENLHDSELI